MKGYKAVFVGSVLVVALGYPLVNGQGARQGTAPAAASAATIERGRYIVDIGGCNDCHTKGYAENGGKAPAADLLKGDTLGYRGPWGTTYPTNLRLSISRMTEDAWLTYAKTLNSRPPMPWFNVRAMTDADLRAVYQYVKSLGDPGAAAPAFLTPDKAPPQPYIQWPGVN